MLKDKMTRVWERLTRKYRLVFYDHESLSQTRFLMVRPLSVILWFFALTATVIIGNSLLIFYTPQIREQIPGYTNPQLEKDYQLLQSQAMGLEKLVEEQDSLLGSFRRIAGLGPSDTMQWAAPVEAVRQEDDQGYAPEGAPIIKEIVRTETLFVEKPVKPQIMSSSSAEPGVLNLVHPVDGIITKSFKASEKHYGVDIAADKESMIRAVADGVIIHSEFSTQNGYVVGIAHTKSDLVTFYKHNSRVFKSVGSYVFAGEAIAVIGNTGKNTSGMHLHFELWYEGNPVNPEDYIQFN